MGGFLQNRSLEATRRQLEVNFFGMLRMAQAFAPVLAANGGGAMLNVLSIASRINRPLLGTYGATKSAAWALMNGLRHELRAQCTQVTGLHMGFVDTDLTRGIEMQKSTPEAIVHMALDCFEQGAEEILADALTAQVSEQPATPHEHHRLHDQPGKHEADERDIERAQVPLGADTGDQDERRPNQHHGGAQPAPTQKARPRTAAGVAIKTRRYAGRWRRAPFRDARPAGRSRAPCSRAGRRWCAGSRCRTARCRRRIPPGNGPGLAS